MLKLLLSALIIFVVLKVGLAVLRALATPIPAPPPPGELRKVNLRYRCSVCGTELKITAAPDEDPEPPRHCLEEMQLVTPVE